MFADLVDLNLARLNPDGLAIDIGAIGAAGSEISSAASCSISARRSSSDCTTVPVTRLSVTGLGFAPMTIPPFQGFECRIAPARYARLTEARDEWMRSTRPAPQSARTGRAAPADQSRTGRAARVPAGCAGLNFQIAPVARIAYRSFCPRSVRGLCHSR